MVAFPGCVRPIHSLQERLHDRETNILILMDAILDFLIKQNGLIVVNYYILYTYIVSGIWSLLYHDRFDIPDDVSVTIL